MPTVKGIAGPYRFFFYSFFDSFDCNEREHIRVLQEDRFANIGGELSL